MDKSIHFGRGFGLIHFWKGRALRSHLFIPHHLMALAVHSFWNIGLGYVVGSCKYYSEGVELRLLECG